MIIGIVGTRQRDTLADFHKVEAAFQKIYQPGDRIVSGGCPQGGDRFAEILALMLAKPGHWTEAQLFAMSPYERHHVIKDRGAPIHIHPAEWDKYGKAAGHRRNTYIARDADMLIAATAANRTGGTEDTINKFLKRDGKTETDLILV
jgi:hypothetical protein